MILKKTFSPLCFSLYCFAIALILVFPSSVQAEESSSLSNNENNTLLKEIKERGVLRVGTASGFSPFEFNVIQDNGENEIVGVDISIAQKIADDLEVELEVVDMQFGNLISSMETGGIDIILAGMSKTPERAKSVAFSEIYYEGAQQIVIREQSEAEISGLEDFESDFTMAVSSNTIQESLFRELYPDSNLVVMDKSADGISALISGQADGVLLDEAVGGAFVAENEDLTLVDSGLSESDGAMAVALPLGEEDLLTAVNSSITEITDQNLLDQYLDEAYAAISAQQQSSWLDYWPYFWDGIKTTLLISFVAIFFGTLLGSALALMRISQSSVLNGIAATYVEVIRGTPLMVQVLYIFLSVGAFFNLGSLISGLIAVSLNSGAYICEIIRGGLNGVDKGQKEAARALGLDYWTTMKEIIFPQSLRSIWPSLGNEFITLIKESSIVSTIGVAELTFQTRTVTSLTYQGLVPLTISMALYLLLTFTLSKLLKVYERKMERAYA